MFCCITIVTFNYQFIDVVYKYCIVKTRGQGQREEVMVGRQRKEMVEKILKSNSQSEIPEEFTEECQRVCRFLWWLPKVSSGFCGTHMENYHLKTL